MTQAVTRTPADVLREARRRDSERKRDQVFRAVDAMKRDGTPITFAAVARNAKVSQWLVYADGVRDYIETARSAQAAVPARAKRAGRSASEASSAHRPRTRQAGQPQAPQRARPRNEGPT